ncbi:MAG: RagB/SusD family nutrient uptake outer membrane protein [Prevotella sp.]|nr:RagB/SusD family nutrient uptake outer membrane protein [Prevotella sp.]
MKTKIYQKIQGWGCALGLLFLTSCSVDDVKPQGMLDEDTAFSSPEKLVTSAYSMLGNDWYSYPFNLWPYGDMSADDCLKGGSGENDTGYHPMEIFSTLQPDRGEFDELWYRLYLAISRCNRALESMTSMEETADIKQYKAEVRFLRAHFYYKLQQMWYEVPFITEGLSNAQIEATRQSSHDEIMQHIIDDFQFAYENLPEVDPGKTGRAHKVAAAAYLAKCYLNWAYGDGYEATTGYDHVDQAKIQKVLEYTEVVKNSNYDYLETYGHIFLQDYANSKESIFAVQHSNKADDGTNYGRANWSNMLNGVWGIWSCGWDFHKPSQNLVNAFKTKNGLPMDNFDEDHNAIVINGADSKFKYDPRLFHTVGMPTYPYKYEAAYTLTKANSRTPNTYGYYCSMKEIPQRSKGEYYDNPWQAFGQNDYVLRYTDVMLMRAEALIESGDFNGEALQIINDIRERAKQDISGTSLIKYAKDQCDISLYGSFASKDDARKALRWERRVELAMEGHRFFDLRRWGLLSTTLNKYFETEKTDEYDGQTYALYYKDAFFTAGKNEYFPIASNQMNYVQGLYHQNKGY